MTETAPMVGLKVSALLTLGHYTAVGGLEALWWIILLMGADNRKYWSNRCFDGIQDY